MQIVEGNSISIFDGKHGYCGQYYKEKVHYLSHSNNITIWVTGFEGHQKKRYNWYLSVRYKFIKNLPIEDDRNHGITLNQSACEYYLTNCDTSNCVVRSPNFPGMYPRNLFCKYIIRQIDIPVGKHALIEISQRNPFKMMVRYRSYHWPVTVDDEPKLWTDCDADIVTVHDGSSTADPILAQFCDSGPLEPLISRGPQMTIAFRSVNFA